MHRLLSHLFGLFFIVAGVLLTLGCWLSAMLSGTFIKGEPASPIFLVVGLYYAVTGAPLGRRNRVPMPMIVIGIIAAGLGVVNYAMLSEGNMKLPVRLFKQIPKEHYSTVGYLFFVNERNLERSRQYLAKRYEEITAAKNSGRQAGLDDQIEEYQVAIEFYNAAVARLKPTPASPTSTPTASSGPH